jgi:hypothetical protein
MSLLFDTVASRCWLSYPRLFSLRAEGEPLRPRSEKRYGFVQARTEGIRTFGADRVVAYKVEGPH